MDQTDKRHGHVTPRLDSVKMRCGGPKVCPVCASELAAIEAKGTPPQEPVGYDDIFNAIAEAASPCGSGISVSVMGFKRAIGGEIFLSPTIPAWQPIETAPKDGSGILLMGLSGRVADGMWMAANGPVGGWVWPYVKAAPTHWMPLLPPPAQEGVTK